MSKAVQVGMLALMVLLVSGTPVMAQDGDSTEVGFGAKGLKGIGAGICVLGVGLGIGIGVGGGVVCRCSVTTGQS